MLHRSSSNIFKGWRKAEAQEGGVSGCPSLCSAADGSERAQCCLPSKDCEYEEEQGVHNIALLLPGVGTYYNLGTALYHAAQNYSETAKERGQDGVIDLCYDLLMTMTGLSGAPMGLAISASLKPAVKAGVQQSIQY